MLALVRLTPFSAAPRPRPSVRRGAATPRHPLAPKARQTTSISLDEMSVDESWSGESLSHMSALMARFERADTDGNGVIDRTELRGLLQTVDAGDEIVPMSWLREEDLDRIMEQYDTNRDGVIQFEEFVAMAQDGVLLEGKLREYQEAFRYLDSNADGRLGAREVFKLFQMLGRPIEYDQLVRMFDEYDMDQSGSIEFPEYLRMFRAKLLDLDQILDYVAMQGQPWDTASYPLDPEQVVRLPRGEVVDIRSQAELDGILSAHPDELVVLMATLTWCSESRGMGKEYEALARHYPGAVFLRLVGNISPAAKALFKSKLKCHATPTFYFFRGGALRGQYQGGFTHKVERDIRLHLFPDEMPPELFPPQEGELVAGRD